MKKLLIACAALTASAAVAAAPAPGSATADAPAQASAAPEKDPNERICRNVVQTSTRLGRQQECKTRAEWEAQDRRNQKQVEGRD